MKYQAKSFIYNKYIYFITGIIVLVLIYLFLRISLQNDILFPSFLEIGESFISFFSIKGMLNIGYSVFRVILSLTISFIISILISFLYFIFKPSINFFKPFLYILKVSPIIAIVLYIQVLTAGSYLAPYIVTTMVMVPIMVEANISAIDNMSNEVLLSLKLENNGKLHKFLKIIIPNLFPFIIMSFLQSISLGIKIVIMVEYFCYLPYGIGTILNSYMLTINIAGIISVIILACILSAIFELLIHLYRRKYLKKT